MDLDRRLEALGRGHELVARHVREAAARPSAPVARLAPQHLRRRVWNGCETVSERSP
jgi:hypothetical protein